MSRDQIAITKPAPGTGARRSRSWLLNLMLAGGSTLLALIPTELYLRCHPTPFIYQSMRNVVQMSCTRPHPKIQYVNRENYTGQFVNPEFNTSIRINARGLRDKEYSYVKTPGIRRCVLLGDSFVFGWGVEVEESVAKVMESRLRATEVINGGCSGWSTLQELEFLKEEGIRYRPDVVTLFFCENDPAENAMKHPFVNGRLRDNLDMDGFTRDCMRYFNRHFALWNLVRQVRHARDGQGDPSSFPEAWQAEEDYLREMNRVCRQHASALAVVYVPIKDADGAPRRGKWFDKLQSFCRRESIPLLDLVSSLDEERRQAPVFFAIDDHWNRNGHRVAAEATLRFLANNRLLVEKE